MPNCPVKAKLISGPHDKNTGSRAFVSRSLAAELQQENRFAKAKLASGRGYDQSDPVGLWGGLNTYLYANNNPERFIDEMGLRCWLQVLKHWTLIERGWKPVSYRSGVGNNIAGNILSAIDAPTFSFQESQVFLEEIELQREREVVFKVCSHCGKITRTVVSRSQLDHCRELFFVTSGTREQTDWLPVFGDPTMQSRWGINHQCQGTLNLGGL